MEQFKLMVQTQSLLFIYIIIGYICQKRKLTEMVARKSLNNLLVYVALPCMIFNSFDIVLTRESLMDSMEAILIATSAAVFALILGKFAYNWLPDQEKRIMQYGTLVSNSGFAGLPIIENAYGSQGLFLASIYIIPTRILMWTAGISLFTNATLKQRIKNVVLNPGIIAVYFGFARMIFQPVFPVPITKAITVLGSMTTPISMILIGMILAGIEIRTVLNYKAFILAFIRQIFMPVTLLIVLKLLGVDPFTTKVAVVLTGMPIGSSTSFLADMYGADTVFASKCVFISTLTSLITIPILALFL